jgi:hypothetical protein
MSRAAPTSAIRRDQRIRTSTPTERLSPRKAITSDPYVFLMCRFSTRAGAALHGSRRTGITSALPPIRPKSTYLPT